MHPRGAAQRSLCLHMCGVVSNPFICSADLWATKGRPQQLRALHNAHSHTHTHALIKHHHPGEERQDNPYKNLFDDFENEAAANVVPVAAAAAPEDPQEEDLMNGITNDDGLLLADAPQDDVTIEEQPAAPACAKPPPPTAQYPVECHKTPGMEYSLGWGPSDPASEEYGAQWVINAGTGAAGEVKTIIPDGGYYDMQFTEAEDDSSKQRGYLVPLNHKGELRPDSRQKAITSFDDIITRTLHKMTHSSSSSSSSSSAADAVAAPLQQEETAWFVRDTKNDSKVWRTDLLEQKACYCLEPRKRRDGSVSPLALMAWHYEVERAPGSRIFFELARFETAAFGKVKRWVHDRRPNWQDLVKRLSISGEHYPRSQWGSQVHARKFGKKLKPEEIVTGTAEPVGSAIGVTCALSQASQPNSKMKLGSKKLNDLRLTLQDYIDIFFGGRKCRLEIEIRTSAVPELIKLHDAFMSRADAERMVDSFKLPKETTGGGENDTKVHIATVLIALRASCTGTLGEVWHSRQSTVFRTFVLAVAQFIDLTKEKAFWTTGEFRDLPVVMTSTGKRRKISMSYRREAEKLGSTGGVGGMNAKNLQAAAYKWGVGRNKQPVPVSEPPSDGAPGGGNGDGQASKSQDAAEESTSSKVDKRGLALGRAPQIEFTLPCQWEYMWTCLRVFPKTGSLHLSLDACRVYLVGEICQYLAYCTAKRVCCWLPVQVICVGCASRASNLSFITRVSANCPQK